MKHEAGRWGETRGGRGADRWDLQAALLQRLCEPTVPVFGVGCGWIFALGRDFFSQVRDGGEVERSPLIAFIVFRGRGDSGGGHSGERTEPCPPDVL